MSITSVKMALMAELLQDVDKLMTRVENTDQSLGKAIEKATSDAANSTYTAAKLNFEAMIDEQAKKLDAAGRKSAEIIGNQISSEAIQAFNSNQKLGNKVMRLAVVLLLCVLVAATVGGYIGAKLALG